MVWPSGAARAAWPTPMVPPAPGRLSMMIGWPSCLESCSNTMRAVMSLALPAANGMMAVIGRVGQDCAEDWAEDCAEDGEELRNKAGIAASNTVFSRISNLPRVLLVVVPRGMLPRWAD